jgi:hypothetical protein
VVEHLPSLRPWIRSLAPKKKRLNKIRMYMELHQNLKLLCLKNTIKVVTQPTEKEKMTVNHILNKELVTRIHKELLQLNNKKPIQFLNEPRDCGCVSVVKYLISMREALGLVASTTRKEKKSKRSKKVFLQT